MKHKPGVTMIAVSYSNTLVGSVEFHRTRILALPTWADKSHVLYLLMKCMIQSSLRTSILGIYGWIQLSARVTNQFWVDPI